MQLELPYLPDWLCKGASLCGLPGVPGQSGVVDGQGHLVFGPSTLPSEALFATGSITQLDFGRQWPQRLPFRLQLAEPPDPNGPRRFPPGMPKSAR